FEKLSNHFKSGLIYSDKNVTETTRHFFGFYKTEMDSVKSEIASLQWMVSDNPVQKARMDSVGKQISDIMPALIKYDIDELVTMNMHPQLEKIIKIQTLINEGIAHERSMLELRTADLEKSTNLTRTFTLLFSII